MKRIGIIGIGRFGGALAHALAEKGAEVLLFDCDAAAVSAYADSSQQAVEGDATDKRALEAAGFRNCGTAVVAIGENIEASVMATLNCKELGIGRVIAMAVSDMHGKVLQRVGADVVVYPNRELAQHLAQTLITKGLVDLFELSEGTGVAQIDVPADWVGRTLAEAKVRNRYGVTVLCIRRLAEDPSEPRKIITPTADEKMLAEDKLLLFGEAKALDAVASR